ncbi:MAG: hypothetical protein RIR12_1735 [Bacteroidota bacterium]|jgi:hypothetical protein
MSWQVFYYNRYRMIVYKYYIAVAWILSLLKTINDNYARDTSQ